MDRTAGVHAASRPKDWAGQAFGNFSVQARSGVNAAILHDAFWRAVSLD